MTINNIFFRPALATALLLLVPFSAKIYADLPWSLFDFIVAGALLFGAGLTYELIARKASDKLYRVAVAIAVLTALMLVWVNLAVGIIGSEQNPANLMYLGVLAVGVIGALIARFRPHGMARSLFATAVAQMLVPVIALIVWRPAVTVEPPGVLGFFVLNLIFALLFIGSALLFRRADRPLKRS
jgi:hypothetical protein